MYLVFPMFTAKPISLQAFNNTSAFLSIVLRFELTKKVYYIVEEIRNHLLKLNVVPLRQNKARYASNFPPQILFYVYNAINLYKTTEKFKAGGKFPFIMLNDTNIILNKKQHFFTTRKRTKRYLIRSLVRT